MTAPHDPYDDYVDDLIDAAARNGWGGEPDWDDDDRPWLPDPREEGGEG